MDRRLLLLLVVLSSCWCCNARDLTVLQSNDKADALYLQEVTNNEDFCVLCEEFASEALNYLTLNKTQAEIVTILHKSCSKIPSFKQQCIVLVDYYAPLFFLEVSSLDAKDFCRKVNLCEDRISKSQELPKDKCDLCHTVVAEALLKLKDPDTELEILEMLLKACDSIGKNAKKCKKLVFEYAPVILINAEQFLETSDLCAVLHACDSAAVVTKEVSLGMEASMHASS
ncbi:prosaposin-like [Salvia divinorum]|uniref:Pulmonary surfactant-associated protein B n=1 Tax=Salvia divinorum TaxID=28513 RepID=A0ABD1GN72_SALDI